MYFRGKFSMRNELGSNKVITKPQEFYNLVLDHKIVSGHCSQGWAFNIRVSGNICNNTAV